MSPQPSTRLPAAVVSIAEARAARTLQARLPHCSGACEAGRSQCNCPAYAGESCTEIGLHTAPPPLHGSQAAYMLAPLIERWPRFAGFLAGAAILTLLVLGGEQPINTHPLGADYLPGDGFPPQLLGAVEEPIMAASEVQP